MIFKVTKWHTKIFIVFASLLILTDIGFSAFEFYGQALKGDLVALILPDELNAPVLQDPFGLKALNSSTYHPNINRYFSVVSLVGYFKSVPFIFQGFVNPVESLYLSSAFIKFLVFLVLIFSLFRIVTLGLFNRNEKILAVLIILVFIQIAGRISVFNFIDSSVVYLFFYGLPFTILSLFLFPILKFNITDVDPLNNKTYMYILYLILGIILLFSSALMSPVLLIIFTLYFGDKVTNWLKTKAFIWNKWDTVFGLLYPIGLYSLILGSFNSESVDPIPILERYAKLFDGLYHYSIVEPALLITWGLSALLFYILKSQNYNIWNGKFDKLVKYGLAFIVVYVLFLPLGGFRSYRSMILRHDTLLPISLFSILLLSILLTQALIHSTKGFRNVSIAIFIMTTIYFSVNDYNSIANDKYCEESILLQIQNSSSNQRLIHIKEKLCPVMDWIAVKEPQYYQNHSKMWRFWNITENEVLISFDKAEW